ncbi:MAG: T9SS type A sorting domain-containing protein [Chitinophagaceae bacterium]|nr:T9SS type A sorting domain-containing protein [Chitinophagaceae bacterium]
MQILTGSLLLILNYRLKIIDKDGAFSYSAIVSISVNDRSSIVSVFPNPVSNGEANVSISATSDGLAHWKLIDNAGRTVMSSDVQLRSGNNSMKINVSSLTSGMYHLSIVGPGIDQKVKLQKL